MFAKVKLNDLEPIARYLMALITGTQLAKIIKKKYIKFFQCSMLSKVKFNDLQTISR